MKKGWHHDIRYIDGRFVEDVVDDYQSTGDESVLEKIMRNYALFKHTWARDFGPYLDGGISEGAGLFDEVVWRSAIKFNREKCQKKPGRAFNAYLTSALMNTLKSLRNTMVSRGPLIKCPLCGENVKMIDEAHLKHYITIERYRKMFPYAPISSWDGMTRCVYTGERIQRMTIARVNRLAGKYTLADWKTEFPYAQNSSFRCPATGLQMSDIPPEYPSVLAPGYTMEDLMSDFPDHPFETCPITGQKMLHIDQAYFNGIAKGPRITPDQFSKQHPNATIAAKQVPVVNPYTGEKVPEITFAMLKEAGVTLKEHLERYPTIILDERYKDAFRCPFTGLRLRIFKSSMLEKLGITPFEFYQASCQFPLRRFQVRCAICGDWVSNIGDHLEQVLHNYAPSVDMHEFEQSYGGRTRNLEIAKTYVENDEGDQTHIADFVSSMEDGVLPLQQVLDVAAIIGQNAKDELDVKIADAMADTLSLEEAIDRSVEKKRIRLPFVYDGQKKTVVAKAVKEVLQIADFDLESLPSQGDRSVSVVIPSRSTVIERIRAMAQRHLDLVCD